ncbi:MAG: hypothetical protein ATN33_05785 [Epulopiscium sp. Nele67-Bin001]|nr:MAG: hypothetical protein ATN33_05785 [Epulopiscium sp. Nele67-Bin001]
MELKIFNYASDVIDRLDEMKIDLDIACREIEYYFVNIIANKCEGYLNINSRVKSSESLKEKILRHDYYNKYKTVDGLYDNLSDLIGIRLECRFVEDEKAIFKLVRAHFQYPHKCYNNYFYNNSMPNVLLELGTKQPKSQKNGIGMYRIDGRYLYQGQIINFELQIKSLINIFWSEIEHKVIYKNYNYVLADRFYKDIMRSIKNSLTTIDQQLLLITNQFERANNNLVDTRRTQVETMLSKIIYDLFAERMKRDIGLLVDFRKSCDTLVKYVFREIDTNVGDMYNSVFITVLNRLNEIDDNAINFNRELEFERPLDFHDSFSLIIGNHIQSVINLEFQWNLFFRILFYIEPENNAGDLETFIEFYKLRLCKYLDTSTLRQNFNQDYINGILDALLQRFASTFVQINLVDLVYDNYIEQVRSILTRIVDLTSKYVATKNEWEQRKDTLLKLLSFRMLALFDYEIESGVIIEFVDEIRANGLDIELHKSLLRYI